MRIALLGAGRMGGWLARQLVPEHVVAVLDPDPVRARAVPGAATLGRLEELAGFAPELLVNAVRLPDTFEVFRAAAPHLPAGCVLADLASIKGALPEYYAGCGHRFASVHPMFGPTFAALDALKGQSAILISESDRPVAALFRGIFERLGIAVVECPFAEHDSRMAYSLALPFACTLAFAGCLEPGAAPGTTFARHLEIARGLLSEDDALLVQVLLNPHAGPQLAQLAERLAALRELLAAGDAQAVGELLTQLRDKVR